MDSVSVVVGHVGDLNVPLVQEIASIMQEYTQSGGVRPFGISLLVIGYDEDKPRLYQVDPSGAFFAWHATAIGKDYTNGKSFLEKVGVERDDHE